MPGPLQGVKVLEFTGLGPAPFAGMLLADLGADVLRIERIDDDDLADRNTKVLLRGRASLQIALKDPRGAEVARRLASQAEILIEGFRPGVMERLGLGPQQCMESHPALVYGRLTGWGQAGPLSRAAGHDINYIALTGVLASIGEADRPPLPPLNLAGDFGGGSLYLAMGVLSALVHARATGKGQVVDAAVVDGASSLMALLFGKMAQGSWHAGRGRNRLDGSCPWYATYETADKKYVAIGALESRFFLEFCRLTGIDVRWTEWREDATRWQELRDLMSQLFRRKTRADWSALFETSDACVTPVLEMDEVEDHAHNRERRMFTRIDGVLQPAPAPRFSETSLPTPSSATACPSLGGWGISASDQEELVRSGLIACRS